MLAAIEAGKAVLCEKPLAVDHGTAMVLVDAARQAGVPLVEAFVYRFHPQTTALLDLIRSGAIGEVQHIDASFAFRKEEREGRLFDAATAGGGILDVGCYPLTFAALVAAAATGVAVAEPTELDRHRHRRRDRRRRVGRRRPRLPRRHHRDRSARASASRT